MGDQAGEVLERIELGVELMAIDFPSSPTLGQIYSTGGADYIWNGYGWTKGLGTLLPALNNTYNLGSATLRWATVYTGDLSLRNHLGDWTIVEGADDLFITNNRTGRRYKFVLEPV